MEELIAAAKQQINQETYKQMYSTLKTDEDRVKFTLRLLREKELLPVLPEPSTKSRTLSEIYREQGNNFFCTPQLDTTIELYTKSIAFAPPGSRELALGYANRSAVLFKARFYQDCLQDISRALALPYPDGLKAKLYARQARCLMVVKSPTKEQAEKLRESLKMAAEYLDKMPADGKGRGMLEEMLKEPEKMVPLQDECTKWRGEDFLPTVSDENPELKGISSAVKLEFNEEFGRHMVATRDIRPGEVLGVMKPYIRILTRDRWFTYCAYCTQQTWSSVPCEDCCHVVYCNDDCKTQAYDEYHDIECLVRRHMIDIRMTALVRVNVRLTAKAIKETGSIQTLREKVKEIEDCKDPRTMGFKQGFLNDEDYASIYTLVRNSEKRSFIDLLEKSLESSYILLILATKTDIFGRKFKMNLDDLIRLEGDADVTFVGGLIMRHEQILCCNAHAVHEGGLHMDQRVIGGMIIPFSQMNHSCNPSTTGTVYGSKMAFHAECSIKKGEQIYDNYGQHYHETPRLERRITLQQNFQFFCNCIACTENWPTSDGLPSIFEQSIPPRTERNLAHVLKNYLNYRELPHNLNFTNPATIIADINKIIEFLQENFKTPCIELTDAIETKRKILALAGRRFQTMN